MAKIITKKKREKQEKNKRVINVKSPGASVAQPPTFGCWKREREEENRPRKSERKRDNAAGTAKPDRKRPKTPPAKEPIPAGRRVTFWAVSHIQGDCVREEGRKRRRKPVVICCTDAPFDASNAPNAARNTGQSLLSGHRQAPPDGARHSRACQGTPKRGLQLGDPYFLRSVQSN